MTKTELEERAAALVPALAERSREIEAARRLPADLSDALGREGFYRMLAPATLGGGEVHPRAFVATLEALARGDAAAAWVAMTSSTTSLLFAYLDEGAARTILDTRPEAAFAGVFAPTGRATPEASAYRVSGRWAYGSGCENAAWRMGGCLVPEGDGVRRLPNGAPAIRQCFFAAEASQVLDTWSVSGLAGTGSHDVVVEDAVVPEAFTCSVLTDSPRHDGPLYRFPVFGLLGVGVAAVGLGIARAALDGMLRTAGEKRTRGGNKTMTESELVQVRLASAEGGLSAARALVHETLDTVWERAAGGDAPTDLDRARIRLAATHAARACARVVDDCYHLAGGAAIWSESPLQRHFRDVHVMTQHVMVGEQTLKPVGRVLLGLETDTTQL